MIIEKNKNALNIEREKFLSLLNLDKSIVRAEGAYLYTNKNEALLDFTSQYGAVPFGHNPEFLWQELIKQSESLPGIMIQPFQSQGASQLSQALIAISPGDMKHVTFSCSGAEAVESAIKMARAKTCRAGILSTLNSFHGKTMATSLATGNNYYTSPFQCEDDDFLHIPYNNLVALEDALKDKTFAAFIVEPIQGEGGMVVPDKDYLKGCEMLCQQYGTLFVVDEIQVGLGRTGTLFACDKEQVKPDIVVIAKALGGGLLPISACISNDKAWSQDFGQRHSSTFANNHLTSRIGLKVIDKLTKDQSILKNVCMVGQYLSNELASLVQDFPDAYHQTSGVGFMQGISLTSWRDKESYFSCSAYEQGHAVPLVASYLLNKHNIFTAPTLNASAVLRIQPNYLMTKDHIDHLITGLRDVGQIITDGHFSEIFRSAIRLQSRDKQYNESLVRDYKTPSVTAKGPKLGTFAFLIHPLSSTNVMDSLPGGVNAYDENEIARIQEWITEFKQVSALTTPTFHIPVIPSKLGGYVEGWLISSLLTPQEMLRLGKKQKEQLMDSYIASAKSKNVNVIGLGAFTSVISRNGTTVADCGTPVTTGNSYTALSTTDSIRTIVASKKRKLSDLHLGVVGAAGSVGRLTLLDIGPECRRLSLIGNPRNQSNLSKLEAVAGELILEIVNNSKQHALKYIYRNLISAGIDKNFLRSLSDENNSHASIFQKVYQHYSTTKQSTDELPIILTNNISQTLPQCDIVISATSNGEAFIQPHMVKRQAIVCDVARPSDLQSGIFNDRKDVTLYEGGLVNLPAAIRFGRQNVVDLKTGVSLACLSETIILTMSQVDKNYSMSGISSIEEARQVYNLSVAHGFSTHLPDHKAQGNALKVTPLSSVMAPSEQAPAEYKKVR